MPLPPDDRSALIVIDVQNGFCPGGNLAVPDGDAIVPLVNRLAARFEHVVLTQDWHPPGHLSFAGSHPGKAPFDLVTLPYGPQVLWPEHCVQGSQDAAFHPGLDVPHAQLVLRKGLRRGVDSYSAFLEADRRTPTGLAGWLRGRGIERLWFCGLATDFCVAWSALDARGEGFEATVVEDACRAIDLNGSLAAAWVAMTDAGVTRAQAASLV